MVRCGEYLHAPIQAIPTGDDSEATRLDVYTRSITESERFFTASRKMPHRLQLVESISPFCNIAHAHQLAACIVKLAAINYASFEWKQMITALLTCSRCKVANLMLHNLCIYIKDALASF